MQKDSIESWNQLFPDAQIRQSDLAHPTEVFLTKSLISYLQILHFKIEPPYHPTNDENKLISREYRQFLIRLALQIDKMLKITNKTYSFTYVDLIRPSPRKTSHTLNILLNYLFYYNMYKTNVCKMANEKIKAYEDIKQQVDSTERNVDNSWKKSEEIKTKLSDYKTEIVKQQDKYAELKQKHNKLLGVLNVLEKSHDKLDTDFMALNKEKRDLSAKVVTNEEVENLQIKMSNIKQSIDLQYKNYEEIENNHKACIKTIEEEEKLYKLLEKVKDSFPTTVLSDFKENQQKIKEEKEQSAILIAKKQEIENCVAEMESKCSIMIENATKIENEMNELKKELKNTQNINRQHQKNEKRINELRLEEHDLFAELDDHKSTNLMIAALAEEVLYK